MKEITQEQFQKIERFLPIQRGNVKNENLTFLNALLYIAKNGGTWRDLPEKYGNWNSVYKKFNRWAKNGTLERVFLILQREKIIKMDIKVLSLDSTSCKVHPDAHGALKKTDRNASANPKEDGIPSFMWSPRMTRLR